MRYVLAIVITALWLSRAFGGEYITVTKNPDGTYLVAPNTQARAVLDKMAEKEITNSIEFTLEHLMRGWHGKLRLKAEQGALKELRDSLVPLSPSDVKRLQDELKQAK